MTNKIFCRLNKKQFDFVLSVVYMDIRSKVLSAAVTAEKKKIILNFERSMSFHLQITQVIAFVLLSIRKTHFLKKKIYVLTICSM